jgi:magnesium-transporting ATPase (P-type)
VRHGEAGTLHVNKSGPQSMSNDNSSRGLTTSEAAARLAQYGPNVVETGRRFRVLREGLGLLANPLVLILLVAALISGFLGEPLQCGHHRWS